MELVSQSLRQEKAKAKEFSNNFLKEVKAMDYVDYLDNSKQWKGARLLAKDDRNMGLLKSIGWPNSQNERLALVNSKVRPFRSESATDTSCYTGDYVNNEVELLDELLQVCQAYL